MNIQQEKEVMCLAWAYLFLFSKNLYDDTFLKVGSENLEKLILG